MSTCQYVEIVNMNSEQMQSSDYKSVELNEAMFDIFEPVPYCLVAQAIATAK